MPSDFVTDLVQPMNLHHKTNVNKAHAESLTVGQQIADSVANIMGSWRFIIIQTIIVMVWIVSNVWLLTHPFDPYPLILLNLVFSTQAAYASPLILMSQNRQAQKDRIAAEVDYAVNRKAEEHTEAILSHLGQQNGHLSKQDDLILKIVERQEEQHKEMLAQLSALARGRTKS